MSAALESSNALEDQLEATRAKREQELMAKHVDKLSELDAHYIAREQDKTSAVRALALAVAAQLAGYD